MSIVFIYNFVFSDVPETTINVVGEMKEKDASGGVDIHESSNLLFSCHVKANPPAYNISWFHNVSSV